MMAILFQSLQEAKTFLYSRLPMFERQGKKGYKPGLERITALCTQLRHPEKKVPFIHIGGTNGKGSTSTLLALQLQKYYSKVGLFTSPHLIELNERIQINFQPILPQEIVDFLNVFWPKLESIQPSFFELITAIGFWYFAKEQCDIAIIEVGMGGRLDSTNIIMPELSIITSIGLDHQAYLGNTLEKIAYEKSGIIKPKKPVLLGEFPSYLHPIFEDQAEKHQSPLFYVHDLIHIHQTNIISIQNAQYQIQELNHIFESDLIGTYQEKNFALAYASMKLLGFEPDLALWRKTNHQGPLKGRMEPVCFNPPILYDVAHNPNATQALIDTIQKLGSPPLCVLFACSNDKDWKKMVSQFPKNTQWIITSSQSLRSESPSTIATHLAQSFPHVTVCEDPVQAYFLLKNQVQPSQLGIVTGTAFLYEKLAPYFSKSNLNQTLV